MLKNKYRPGKVISISSAHFVHDVYSSFLPPILPLLIEKFGISLSVAGLLSLFQRLPSLFSVVVGAYAHRLPWRLIILMAPLVTATAGSLLGVAPGIVVLAILLLTMGISSAVFHVPAPVMIKEYSGPKAGLGMSFYMLGGETARMTGPLLIISAVGWWGLEGTWRLILPAIAATIALSYGIEKKPFEKDAVKNEGEILKWHGVLKKYAGFFGLLTMFLIFRAVMKSSLATFLPVYVGDKGGTLMAGAVSLSILQVAGAVGSFLGGGISDKWGRFNTLLVVSLVSPLLMFMYVYTTGILQISALLMLGLSLYSGTPVLLALVQEQGSAQPALMNAGFTTINFVTSALAVLFTGFMGDVFGLDKTYILAAIIATGSIPVLILLKRKNRVDDSF